MINAYGMRKTEERGADGSGGGDGEVDSGLPGWVIESLAVVMLLRMITV